MAMANLASSEGWKFITPSGNQRRAPLTPLPTPGMSTTTSSTKATKTKMGTSRSHRRRGTAVTTAAVLRPMTMASTWRLKKCVGL